MKKTNRNVQINMCFSVNWYLTISFFSLAMNRGTVHLENIF